MHPECQNWRLRLDRTLAKSTAPPNQELNLHSTGSTIELPRVTLKESLPPASEPSSPAWSHSMLLDLRLDS